METKVHKVIAELMQMYDAKRAEWIKLVGSDKGYDEWFSSQIPKKK